MSKKQIYINVSDIASFINQNKWDFVTPFERIWKRYDDIGYNNCLNELNNKVIIKQLDLKSVKDEKILIDNKLNSNEITSNQYCLLVKKNEEKQSFINSEIKSTSKNIDNISLSHMEQLEKHIGSELINLINENIIETNDKRKITNTAIEKLDISLDEKESLLIKTKSLINKSHGIIKENSGIDLFQTQFNVTLDISQTYNKILFKETDFANYYLGGKCDGINNNKDDEFIVEVKSRTKCFFNTVRDYENTQVQIYMHLLNIKNSKLVEYLAISNKIKVTNIKIDQKYINDVLHMLDIFVINFEKFIFDKLLKIEYIELSDDNKKVFLNNLYLKEIKNFNLRDIINRKEICLINDLD